MKPRQLTGTALIFTAALLAAGITPAAASPAAAGTRTAAGGRTAVGSPAVAGTRTAARGAGASQSWNLTSTRVQESARGAARTLALPGGGFVAAHSFGAIERLDAGDHLMWSLGSQALYRDWHLTWMTSGTAATPQLAWGGLPAGPLTFAGAIGVLVNNTHPLAAGSLNGREVVAVAETVGVDMTNQQSCELCTWPFRVPGSGLHLGTFVSVLDARTGAMLYHEVVPGFVTQLVIAGDRLVVGQESGDPQRQPGIGAWGSVSALQALAFTADWHASRAWSYDTVPWGRLLDIAATRDGGIALGWSDTPSGLGTPRPPDGHVLMLDARTGRLRWQQRTSGYPVLISVDDERGELAVAQLTDPLAATGYTLTGLRYRDGRTALSAPLRGWVPVSLAVGRPGWAVGSADASRNRVTLTDPAAGTTRWAVQVPGIPGGLAFAGDRLAADGWAGPVAPTAATPLEELDTLTFLDAITGRSISSVTGDPGDPMSLSADGDSVRTVSSHQVVTTWSGSGKATATGVAGPGEFLTSMTAPSTGDLIGGNENGTVYAFDTRSRLRWQTLLPGPVHQVVAATLHGQPVLIAAATNSVGVLDARDGHLIRLIEVPGTYVYTVTVTAAGAIIVPGTSLTAYSMTDGSRTWRYTAPQGAWFSDAVAAGNVVNAEYSSTPGQGNSASVMAAVGINADNGAVLWTQRENPATTFAGQLWNGVAAGPDGVAFGWETPDGTGRVEVRDPRTGALAYSDTSDVLSELTGYTRSAAYGLVAQSIFGAQIIGRGGGHASYNLSGMSAVVTGRTLVTAEETVSAWGSDAFNPSASALTVDSTYWTAQLTDDGAGRIAGTGGDFLTMRIVRAETGISVHAFYDLNQHGLEVLTLARSASTPAHAVRRPATGPAVPLEPARTGAAHPFIAGAAAGMAGYDPAQMRDYLRPRGDGAGQTIAIVDAYDDPSIVSDAQAFSKRYGLPGVCGAGGAAGNCFTLDVRELNRSAGADSGWALETSLDVEWAHAIAPRARIVLVEAGDQRLSSLFGAVAVATSLRPSAVSMSWGLSGGEFSDETWYDHYCKASGTVCVASSGDYGHPGSYPAYNPAVVAVGGTTLNMTSTHGVGSELSWSGSGGGQSWVEAEPAAQRGVQHSGQRQMPDVSFDADPATGVDVLDSVPYNGQSGWWQVGGTSLGAPSWSALLADADQLRATAGKPSLTSPSVLYRLPSSAIARITMGAANGYCPVGCTPSAGYDQITGLGSPRAGIDAALAAAP